MRFTNSSVVSSRFSRFGLDLTIIALRFVDKTECAYHCRIQFYLRCLWNTQNLSHNIACDGQAPTQNQNSETYSSTMMTTSSSPSPVTLAPILMTLINALHEFLCRFFSFFQLGLGFDHNRPSVLWTRLSVLTAENLVLSALPLEYLKPFAHYNLSRTSTNT